MITFTPEDIDESMQQDLKDELSELYEASEQYLIELELKPSDKEVQRALFRSVHTIKGDLGLVGFMPMIAVLQDLEDLLDLLRKDEIAYTSSMHDLVLGMLDLVNEFVTACIVEGKANYDQAIIDKVNVYIRKIQPDNIKHHESLLSEAISILKNETIKDNSQPSDALSKTGVPKELAGTKQEDVLFFRELMRPIEKRVGYKEGRGDRLARLALYIVESSDRNVPLDQLAVACYVHDFGMAFMPNEVVRKTSLSPLETNLLRSHVYKSTRLIEHLEDWNQAHKIVMQHHENVDGSGYPLGLSENDICEGAKLLGILIRYDELIHSKVQPFYPRAAIIELNKRYKSQLSDYWLQRFNQCMANLLGEE